MFPFIFEGCISYAAKAKANDDQYCFPKKEFGNIGMQHLKCCFHNETFVCFFGGHQDLISPLPRLCLGDWRHFFWSKCTQILSFSNMHTENGISLPSAARWSATPFRHTACERLKRRSWRELHCTVETSPSRRTGWHFNHWNPLHLKLRPSVDFRPLSSPQGPQEHLGRVVLRSDQPFTLQGLGRLSDMLSPDFGPTGDILLPAPKAVGQQSKRQRGQFQEKCEGVSLCCLKHVDSSTCALV